MSADYLRCDLGEVWEAPVPSKIKCWQVLRACRSARHKQPLRTVQFNIQQVHFADVSWKPHMFSFQNHKGVVWTCECVAALKYDNDNACSELCFHLIPNSDWQKLLWFECRAEHPTSNCCQIAKCHKPNGQGILQLENNSVCWVCCFTLSNDCEEAARHLVNILN